jgi:hypothetical protein
MTTTPEGFVVETCRTETCQAPIVWARTVTGKVMPVDAEPSDDGNIRLYERQGIIRAEVVTAVKISSSSWRADPTTIQTTYVPLEAARSQAGPLRTSHFATCQRAADWRKPR